MAVNVGSAEGGEDEVLSAINTTPLVDVMLVLLIIFLITIPVVVPEIPLKLPEQVNQPLQTQPQNIQISVDQRGDIYWNAVAVENIEELLERLKKAAAQSPQPEVHIRGDRRSRYETVGKVVFACQRAGIAKLGFILQPPAAGA